ncbi:Protein of unknown function [Marinobacter persicus]|uniref:DUF3261 domain-containing protein n=2 Tax=Marinobacter persicus TaxID=930118 RepID=A0A1I3WPM1_9GAMM|nr:Protein of unknown function [Marinobacter persicus]
MLCRVLVLTAMAALAGCQTLGVHRGPATPPLLEPGSSGLSVQLNQRMTLQMDGRKHHMMVVASFTPEQTRMTGFTLTGQRLMDIVHEGDDIRRWQSDKVKREIPARWLLSQLQLAYWPAEVLQAAYTGPWVFAQGDRQRSLRLEDELLVMVKYAADFDGPGAGSELTITHHRMALEMTIETLKIKDVTAGSGPDSNHEAGQ